MKVNRFLKIFIVFIGLFTFINVYAADGVTNNNSDISKYSVTNDQTNYSAFVDDQMNLLSDEQKSMLLEDMKPLTEYGHIGFVSISCNNSTSLCANEYYHSKFNSYENGTIFMIDMNDRMLYVFSDGHNYEVITDYKAEVITDNIYQYASRGDYYGCAKSAFNQANRLLAGEKIAAPMRYMTNALLSLFLGFLICFIFIMNASRMNKNKSILHKNYIKNLAIANFSAIVTGHHTVYNPPSSSDSSGFSGGGGGFSGGGGGFSGGGSSGGGGGHHF